MCPLDDTARSPRAQIQGESCPVAASLVGPAIHGQGRKDRHTPRLAGSCWVEERRAGSACCTADTGLATYGLVVGSGHGGDLRPWDGQLAWCWRTTCALHIPLPEHKMRCCTCATRRTCRIALFFCGAILKGNRNQRNFAPLKGCGLLVTCRRTRPNTYKGRMHVYVPQVLTNTPASLGVRPGHAACRSATARSPRQTSGRG